MRIVLVLAAFWPLLNHAACFNLAQPSESPSPDVERFYNIHVPSRVIHKPGWDGRDTRLATTGDHREIFEGEPNDVIVLPHLLNSSVEDTDGVEAPGDFSKMPKNDLMGAASGNSNSVNDTAFGIPPFVWPNTINPVDFDQKKPSKTGGAIFYYEPNGKGGRRLCRLERWYSRDFKSDYESPPSVIRRDTRVSQTPLPGQLKTPIVAALTRDYFLAGYSNFEYNSQNLISKVGLVCFYYTPDGQLRWMGQATPTRQCLDKKPADGQEPKIETLFNAQGKAYGAVGTQEREWQVRVNPDSNERVPLKGWYQDWRMNYGGGKVYAMVDSRFGLHYLTLTGTSLGVLDDNRYNTGPALGNSKPYMMAKDARERMYEFPVRMSDEVLRHPETFYQYERVRITNSSFSLYERFAAGSSQLLSRLWLINGNNNVAREEFFKNGKLIRAIAADYSTKAENKNLWDEDFEIYRPLIKACPFENVYLRVYEYDSSGKEFLVAIGWTNYPRALWYAAQDKSRKGMVNAAIAGVKRFVTRKPKPNIPDSLVYYFASPDGKVKYRNFDELEKRYGPFQNRGTDSMFPNRRVQDQEQND